MPVQAQSVSPLAPIGVNAALDPSVKPRPKIFDEFALTDRVGIVSGANRGLGLEMALTLCELGARAVYCLDLPETPSEEWQKTKEYVAKLGNNSRLEYISVDVTDQEKLWKIGEDIGNKEKRMDICIAAAGILRHYTDCLEYPAKQFQEVMGVNVNGALFTAQAAGRQMLKFGNGGSIILISSISGSVAHRDQAWVSYNTSKSGVLQMARSMACELGPKKIRVNTISPGYIHSKCVVSKLSDKDCTDSANRMTAAYLDKEPHLVDKWSSLNPRVGLVGQMKCVVL
ncbi:hypothetical protein Ac2012v2_001506 [Leucoagaricus gongylophorus]